MKNDTVCKEKASNVFLKEREQYFEIQDLKAKLQDKNIAISELKKLIEKNKGKGVDTTFEKQSILGKPPLQPIRNQPAIPIGQRFSPNKSSNVYLKTTPPRFGLTWKPTVESLLRTDFESWQQRIRLGKDNGENIMKFITEGPFQMGTMRDTLTEGGEGALHLGPKRARVYRPFS
ncbi:hypothetical protein Tco_0717446 [Tanacetum coccineum]